MEKQTSIQKDWIQSLSSNDPQRAIPALYEIRNSGSVKMIPELLTLIRRETHVDIRAEILKLLSEIKAPEAIPLIAESLGKNDFGEYLPAVVAACWQSGLDFSRHLRIFARLFIIGDYITSLEAFTLLEESFPNASEEDRRDCIHYLRESENLVLDEKLPLYIELRRVIEKE